MSTIEQHLQSQRNTESDLATLKADLVQVRSDLKCLMDSAVGRASKETTDLVESARDGLKSGMHSVETYIEHRPFTTVLVALGTGMILAKVFSK